MQERKCVVIVWRQVNSRVYWVGFTNFLARTQGGVCPPSVALPLDSNDAG